MTGPAKALAPPFFTNAGSKADVITVPPGTPGVTSQIQTAQKNKPALYHVIGFIADASRDGTLSNFRTIDAAGIYKPN